jgi:hypothetical protein
MASASSAASAASFAESGEWFHAGSSSGSHGAAYLEFGVEFGQLGLDVQHPLASGDQLLGQQVPSPVAPPAAQVRSARPAPTRPGLRNVNAPTGPQRLQARPADSARAELVCYSPIARPR